MYFFSDFAFLKAAFSTPDIGIGSVVSIVTWFWYPFIVLLNLIFNNKLDSVIVSQVSCIHWSTLEYSVTHFVLLFWSNVGIDNLFQKQTNSYSRRPFNSSSTLVNFFHRCKIAFETQNQGRTSNIQRFRISNIFVLHSFHQGKKYFLKCILC